jgi:long-chain fatty acid transport protein
MRIRRMLQAGLVLIINAFIAAQVSAGGFILFEQGVKGLGNAFAGGSAEAEDASTIFYNPAGLTRLPGDQVEAGAQYIVPRARFSDEGSTLSPVLGAASLTGDNGGDGGKAGLVPNLYYAHEISDQFHAGIGITVPFGLETRYDRHWVGRYHAVDSEVFTFDFNPSLAYRVNSWLSIGGGVSAQYIDAKLTNAVDFGAIGAIGGAPTLPQSLDGYAAVRADDWGWRWNIGALAEPSETLRFGLAYRSDIDYTLTGHADIDTPAGAESIAAGAGLVDTGAKADITLPGHASLSAYWQFHPKWALMGDVFWTHWSCLNELLIKLDTGTNVRTTLDWEDTFRYALGLTYYYDPNWTFRVGAAYDETPIPNASRRTPRIPGNDRIWATLGMTHRFSERLGLDLAYAHLFVDDPEINKTGLDTEDITRGSLVGSYDASVNIFSAQISVAF